MSTNKTSRVKYGFELKFPAKFTMRELVRLKRGSVKYPTLYQRVQRALESGEVKPEGVKQPHVARRGRREIVFVTVPKSAKSEAAVATPAATA